jgi:aspartyl-tRNA(Asn)/glutamyl-tRNA(Gln) amidotransferase subunit A
MALSRPFHELTAAEIATAVAKGRATPDDVLAATLDRISLVDDQVKAWSYLDIEGARRQASVLTKEAALGTLRGPLHGVPVGIKDEFHVQGMPTGMRDLADPPMELEDATCVARLRAAGAIILGKTTMPINGKIPPTRNPWNLEHTPGGTSGGSGAAVGAHMVPVALGEQTFGSNLRPAAFCGVPALKPTYGRISRFGCMVFVWSLDHVGIIAASVPDIALVLSVIAGPDPKDPTAFADPPPRADLSSPARPPRIGVIRNYFFDASEDSMRDAIEVAAKRFTDKGAEVVDVQLPQEFGLSWQIHRLISGSEGSTLHADQHEGTALAGSAGRSGALIPAPYYLQARRVRSWLIERLVPLLETVDAWLMPTAPGPAPKGQATGNATFLLPWSALGFPAANVPVGLAPNGLPLGLQLVAAPRRDYELLQTAAWCENVLGRLPSPLTA